MLIALLVALHDYFVAVPGSCLCYCGLFALLWLLVLFTWLWVACECCFVLFVILLLLL